MVEVPCIDIDEYKDTIQKAIDKLKEEKDCETTPKPKTKDVVFFKHVTVIAYFIYY